MKRFLLCIVMFFAMHQTSEAQFYKIFLAKDGSITDSVKAKYYMFYKQNSDTSWLAKQYTMDNIIVMSGSYKDSKLNIPNGRFIYYYEGDLIWKKEHKIGHVDGKIADTSNYITKTGAFSNGKRVGKWLMLNRNGGRIRLDTYFNDEQNGLTELYAAYSDTTVMMRGNYLKNLKEGYWDSFNTGNMTSSELYEHGIRKKGVLSTLTFGSPSLPDKYTDYLKDNLSAVLTKDITAKYNVAATITKNGKIISPTIVGFESERLKMKDQILKIISKSTLPWKPAYNSKLKQIIDESVIFSIIVKNGEIENCYINSMTGERH